MHLLTQTPPDKMEICLRKIDELYKIATITSYISEWQQILNKWQILFNMASSNPEIGPQSFFRNFMHRLQSTRIVLSFHKKYHFIFILYQR